MNHWVVYSEAVGGGIKDFFKETAGRGVEI